MMIMLIWWGGGWLSNNHRHHQIDFRPNSSQCRVCCWTTTPTRLECACGNEIILNLNRLESILEDGAMKSEGGECDMLFCAADLYNFDWCILIQDPIILSMGIWNRLINVQGTPFQETKSGGCNGEMLWRKKWRRKKVWCDLLMVMGENGQCYILINFYRLTLLL